MLNKAAKSGETYVNALKTADEKSDKVSTLKKALAKKTSELAQVQSVASDSVKAAQEYQRNMQSAREAVAAHEWSDAAVYYKAARKVHVSIENRTALEQLNYLERADKEIQADNWPSALNLYRFFVVYRI
ncbi:hypothetical protein H7R52_00245 [Weissella confusa]|uniref:Uncharacterized protein n=1 Tax=Weissella confusa TaxID=1583 RepID=A0A923NFZ9_WEICO|nr:hypothetical protein [Weissella confusa]